MQFAGDGITPYIRIRGDEFPADKLKAEIDALGIEEVFVMAESAAVRQGSCRAVDGVKFAFPSKFFSDGEDRVTAEQYEAMARIGRGDNSPCQLSRRNGKVCKIGRKTAHYRCVYAGRIHKKLVTYFRRK